MDHQLELGRLPTGQHNAFLDDELVMRVGIPHRGGKLAFHAFNEGYPVMVSANAFLDAEKSCFRVPEATDLSELDVALDSAGFTAMKLWKSKGQQRAWLGYSPGHTSSTSNWRP